MLICEWCALIMSHKVKNIDSCSHQPADGAVKILFEIPHGSDSSETDISRNTLSMV